MSTLLPLHETVAMATARYLLDHNDVHSKECRSQAQIILRHLKSNFYTAVSKDVLEQFITKYPKELTGELLCALVPPHLKSLALKNCQKLLDEGLVTENQYINTVLQRCLRLQSLSFDDCNLHCSLDLCAGITQNASGLSSLSLENCQGVNDDMVQMLIRGLPGLKYVNLSFIRQVTDRVFALQRKQDSSGNFPGSKLTSVELAGCRQLTSTCIRHLTELCGPNLQSLNVSNTGMDCTLLLYLSGYSLGTSCQLAIFANGEDTMNKAQIVEFNKALLSLQQKEAMKDAQLVELNKEYQDLQQKLMEVEVLEVSGKEVKVQSGESFPDNKVVGDNSGEDSPDGDGMENSGEKDEHQVRVSLPVKHDTGDPNTEDDCHQPVSPAEEGDCDKSDKDGPNGDQNEMKGIKDKTEVQGSHTVEQDADGSVSRCNMEDGHHQPDSPAEKEAGDKSGKDGPNGEGNEMTGIKDETEVQGSHLVEQDTDGSVSKCNMEDGHHQPDSPAEEEAGDKSGKDGPNGEGIEMTGIKDEKEVQGSHSVKQDTDGSVSKCNMENGHQLCIESQHNSIDSNSAKEVTKREGFGCKDIQAGHCLLSKSLNNEEQQLALKVDDNSVDERSEVIRTDVMDSSYQPSTSGDGMNDYLTHHKLQTGDSVECSTVTALSSNKEESANIYRSEQHEGVICEDMEQQDRPGPREEVIGRIPEDTMPDVEAVDSFDLKDNEGLYCLKMGPNLSLVPSTYGSLFTGSLQSPWELFVKSGLSAAARTLPPAEFVRTNGDDILPSTSNKLSSELPRTEGAICSVLNSDNALDEGTRTTQNSVDSSVTKSAIEPTIMQEKNVQFTDQSAKTPDQSDQRQSNRTKTPDAKDQTSITYGGLQRLYNPTITCLDISNIKFDEVLARTCLQEFFLANKGLKKLTVEWTDLQDSLLHIIAKASSELQYLALYNSDNITSAGLAHLLTNCPKLQVLNLHGACFISDFALMPLFIKGERCCVTSLQLSETNVTNSCLSCIGKYLGSKLTSLELSWCDEITEVGLHDVLSNCTCLEAFHARQGTLSGDSLVTLTQNCTGLTCLNLSSVDSLTDSVVLEMARNMHHMKELDISWNLALTDDSISAVMCNCPLLVELNIAGLKRTTEKPLLPIVADFGRWRRCLALIRLKMRERRVLRDAGDPHLSSDEEYEDLYVPVRSTSYVPHLYYIDVEYCDQMKDKVLGQIVAICCGTLTIKDYYGEDIIPKLLPSGL